MVNYITFNQQPIKPCTGLIISKVPRYAIFKDKHFDVVMAMKYKTIEERRKLYNDFKYRYKQHIISYIPD